MSAHLTFSASKSATALRSSSSTGEATALSRRQAQPCVGRGRRQPGPHKALDLPAASVRVLTPHPLLVQLHAEIMHL